MPELKMPQINRTELTGRLLRDPELKYYPDGTAYLKTGVAVDDGFKDKKKTYFVDIKLNGEFAERIHPELSKGTPVYFAGKLTIEEWEAKTDGAKHSKIVILCSQLIRLSWPESSEYTREDNQTPSPVKTSPSPSQTRRATIEETVPEDDIPF